MRPQRCKITPPKTATPYSTVIYPALSTSLVGIERVKNHTPARAHDILDPVLLAPRRTSFLDRPRLPNHPAPTRLAKRLAPSPLKQGNRKTAARCHRFRRSRAGAPPPLT